MVRRVVFGAAAVGVSLLGLAEGCGGDSETGRAGSRPDASPPDAAGDATSNDPPSSLDKDGDTTIPVETDSGLPADAAAGVYADCKTAHALYPTAPSGAYMIDPDGAGAQSPIPIHCDMTTAGGGWTLGLLKNSVDNGNYATFGSGSVNVSALTVDPKLASVTAPTSPALAGWIDLNTFNYAQLVIEGFTNGASTFRSAAIAKASLRIAFGQNGYLLYGDANGYFWCGGAATYTDDGVGQINKPLGAPDDCKGHGSLGNGWDFGTEALNSNLTVCGGASGVMKSGPTEAFITYPTPGSAQAIWVR
jgi:hypothetical protein